MCPKRGLYICKLWGCDSFFDFISCRPCRLFGMPEPDRSGSCRRRCKIRCRSRSCVTSKNNGLRHRPHCLSTFTTPRLSLGRRGRQSRPIACVITPCGCFILHFQSKYADVMWRSTNRSIYSSRVPSADRPTKIALVIPSRLHWATNRPDQSRSRSVLYLPSLSADTQVTHTQQAPMLGSVSTPAECAAN